MSNRTPLSRACLLGLALALAAPLAQAVKPADSATLPAPGGFFCTIPPVPLALPRAIW